MQLSTLSIILICAIAACIGFLIGRKSADRLTQGDINQRYLKGFNFLLNDQSDKALEVFIDALEVDKETVELHLALGGLFRRQGQIDRATRIHQNIIARPNLSEDYHFQAVFELAQDYMIAGLQDRAEGLFLELVENHVFLESSYTELMNIYESQKEWTKALAMANKLEVNVDVAKRASHYHYELAEKYCHANDAINARQHMQKARKIFPTSSRYGLMSLKMSLRFNDINHALQVYADVIDSSMDVRSLMQSELIDKMFENPDEKLNDFLITEMHQRPGVKVLQTFLQLHDYSNQSCHEVYECVMKANGNHLNAWFIGQISKLSDEIALLARQQFGSQMVDAITQGSEYFRYQCRECGFQSKVLNWCCPGCQVWETQESLMM